MNTPKPIASGKLRSTDALRGNGAAAKFMKYESGLVQHADGTPAGTSHGHHHTLLHHGYKHVVNGGGYHEYHHPSGHKAQHLLGETTVIHNPKGKVVHVANASTSGLDHALSGTHKTPLRGDGKAKHADTADAAKFGFFDPAAGYRAPNEWRPESTHAKTHAALTKSGFTRDPGKDHDPRHEHGTVAAYKHSDGRWAHLNSHTGQVSIHHPESHEKF